MCCVYGIPVRIGRTTLRPVHVHQAFASEPGMDCQTEIEMIIRLPESSAADGKDDAIIPFWIGLDLHPVHVGDTHVSAGI